MSRTNASPNALPKAVQKQIADADAIIEKMQAEGAMSAPADPEAEAVAAAAAIVTPTETQVTPVEPTPETQAAPVEPTERTDWKQKYNVLQGKYNAEVPRLQADLKEATGVMGGMRQQMNDLASTVQTLKATQTPAAPAAPVISEEETEQFGPDLIDIIRRVAKDELGTELNSKLQPVRDSVKQVNQTLAQNNESVALSAREKLYERLESAVPTWNTINKSEEFLSWLKEEDSLSGQIRGAMLSNSFQANDSERVIKFFKGFQNENVVETSDPSPATLAPAKPESQQTLDTLVAPGTPKTGSTGAQEESGKRNWTQKDVTSLYGAKNDFVKRNPGKKIPDELAAAERDLIRAQSEGRIR